MILLTLDAFLLVGAILPALVLLFFRRIGSHRLLWTSSMLKKIGLYPIRDHYYEPMFNHQFLHRALEVERNLPGIDLRAEAQKTLLQTLSYSGELELLELHQPSATNLDFTIDNGSFGAGDAEFLYQFIRYYKPRKVFEIGCGSSTRIIQLALDRNERENGISFEHICVEPYEQPWLTEFARTTVIRDRIEALDIDWATELGNGDLLFIDSSHIIRPQGDVLTEYLEILPRLSEGVFIHIHDIFTPRDYPAKWVIDSVRFWNEQYLMEALISDTDRYEVVAALNFLRHHHFSDLKQTCPYLEHESEPGSFYLRVAE